MVRKLPHDSSPSGTCRKDADGDIMLATENAAHLLTRITSIAQAADEAVDAAGAIEAEAAGRGTDWLPGIRSSLRRIQLEHVDLADDLRELREALRSLETLQPRLLD